MANKKVLDQLPPINIDVPLPGGELPEGKVLAALASPLRNAEKEFAVGIIVTAAVRNGSWCAVSASTFSELLACGPGRFMAQGIVNSLFQLADDEYLELVTVDGVDYVVPRQNLADIAAGSQLGYY